MSEYVKGQVVEWRGTTCIVVERLTEGKSRIKDAQGDVRVILDSFLKPVGDVIGCAYHGTNDSTAPLFYEIDEIKKRSKGGDYRELLRVRDEEMKWYLKAASCETCRVILARAICSACGRLKGADGNCEGIYCTVPEGVRVVKSEGDVEIMVKKVGNE